MRRSFLICTVALLAMFLASQRFMAQVPDANKHLIELSMSTALNRDSMGPLHLRMSYQLYDLDGKPTSNGTAEGWWDSSINQRISITPSPVGSQEANSQGRDTFLIRALLNQVVQPMPAYNSSDKIYAAEAMRKFGKQNFSCIAVSSQSIKPSEVDSYKGIQYCFDPASNILRAVFLTSSFAILHNTVMKFRNVTFSAADSISSSGKSAITGHIEALDAARYNDSPAMDSPPDPLFFLADSTLMRNRIINKFQPDYPDEAKQNHISGTVMLGVVISKEGKVKSLDVVSSPAPSLTKSSINAVSRWSYKPYLVNGQPVEIETAITVNYNLSR